MDFVKEGKIEEERKKRQAEWDRVRKKDDPIGNLIENGNISFKSFKFPYLIHLQFNKNHHQNTLTIELCTIDSRSNMI